jgi:small subunit ribosomal protein S17
MSELLRNNRKERIGVVTSNKMDKTLVVKLQRRVHHVKYKKIVTKTINVKVHDNLNECNIGDIIVIREVRPLSKDKRWIYVSKVDNKGEIK